MIVVFAVQLSTFPDTRSTYEVMVILTRSCINAGNLEQFYINKLGPRDGIMKPKVDQMEIQFVGAVNPAKVKDIWDIEAPF